jgi:diguanylate cyclase (GGDEF)-like protein
MPREVAAPGRLVRRAFTYLPKGQSLSEDVWRVRHRTLSYLLRAHVVAIFCFALLRGYGITGSLMYAGVIGVFAYLGSTDSRRRKFVSAMTALGLVSCSAVLVNLSGGVTEMHFHFFVIVGILTLYQDWLPFLLAIGFVVMHHALLGVLDASAVFSNPLAIANPIPWALVHGGFVLAASVTSVVAWRLNEEQAFRDSLTKLPNRALFQDRVAHALARADRRPGVLAVLFVDLDGFKDVNDSLGHAAGDHLLCNVAERLRASVRSADTAARLGGDEFAILLEDVASDEDALRAAQRILDALSVPFMVGGRETTVSASIGVAVNSGADTVDDMLRNADVAMYKVKESGRGRYELFAAAMHTEVVDRVELGHDLVHAVDRGELVLYYQPLVSLTTGRITSLEALVRWQHPTRGLLPPAEFIELAEETGAIVAIGNWVIDTACHQMARWNSGATDPLTISVNLSPVQVFRADLVDTAVAALSRSGLLPRDLVFELTEEVMLKDTEAAARRLHALKAVGVRLAIDDFGTGYSSLNYLRRLPIDILKIDKSFIDGIVDDDAASALTGGIINLARALGLDTVAEGVERPEQLAELRRLGCDHAQGFLMAKPMPAVQIATLIASGEITKNWIDEFDRASGAMSGPGLTPATT